ncbi:MAG TPA: hypothetical protein P5079_03680 [Elusimicrobiota bacterium]|nr:hypothetical protein [Elusimicrobiota bacterium]
MPPSRLFHAKKAARWMALWVFALNALLPGEARAPIDTVFSRADRPAWTAGALEKHPYVFQRVIRNYFFASRLSSRRATRQERGVLDTFVRGQKGEGSAMGRQRFMFRAVLFFYPLTRLLAPPGADSDQPLG